MTKPLIEITDISKKYSAKKSLLFKKNNETVALKGVNLTINAGESVAIIGESGSGKSSLLRIMLGLSQADSGTVTFDGKQVSGDLRDRQLWLRRRTGIVFQDPYATFNPRRTAWQSIIEPLEAIGFTGDKQAAASAMVTELNLPQDCLTRYPHEFSGGQLQRLAIARALIHNPDTLFADEPISALDAVIKIRIISLLRRLRTERNLTLVTVTHDLTAVPELAERVIVMHRGEIVEDGATVEVLNSPKHPYTRSLIAAIPQLPNVS